MHGQTGLPATGRTGEGHEPIVGDERAHGGDRVVAADEAGELQGQGQVVGDTTQRTQGREVPWQSATGDLVDTL